jgi:hypothetical protein
MNPDELARIVAASITRHQSRGLVDDAAGLVDVVIHGRVDMISVARDVLVASGRHAGSARRSWAAWFAGDVDLRRDAERQKRRRQALAEQLRSDPTPVETAITRMRMRALDG